MKGPVEQAVGATHTDTAGLPKRLESRKMVLEARSLANLLSVLRRRLAALKDEPHTKEDLAHYQRVLDDVDARWRDAEGTFAGRLAPADPKTATMCSRLYNECFDMLEAMQHTVVEMPAELHDMHGRLLALQARLAKMQADADHTLADVMPLQEALDEIDAERLSKGGSFASGTTNIAPGENACNEVLNHCYEILADCVRRAEDVSPEMKGVYDRLRGVKDGLRRLKAAGRCTVEDLAHYQGQLDRIDASRTDGVFCGNMERGVIPHGQAAAAKLLEECYDLVEGLAGAAEGLAPDLKEAHAQLEGLRHELEGMLRRQRTALELRAVQEKLDAVDDERQAHAGVWAHPAEPGVQTLSTLLNHNYRVLGDLLHDVAVEGGAGGAAEE